MDTPVNEKEGTGIQKCKERSKKDLKKKKRKYASDCIVQMQKSFQEHNAGKAYRKLKKLKCLSERFQTGDQYMQKFREEYSDRKKGNDGQMEGTFPETLEWRRESGENKVA